MFSHPHIGSNKHSLNSRRLENFIHSLRAQSALHKVTNGDGADKSRQPGIFTLFFDDIVCKNLCGVVEGLQSVRKKPRET